MALALKAWVKLCLNNFHMDVPEWSTEEKEKWALASNTAMQFVYDKYKDLSREIIINKKEFYHTYSFWCAIEGHDFPFKKARFFEEILRNKRFTIKRTAMTINVHIEPDITNDDVVPF